MQQHMLIKIGRGARNAPYHLLAGDGMSPLCGVAHNGENYVLRWNKNAGQQRVQQGVGPCCVVCQQRPARKLTISGMAEWRCQACERAARMLEQQAITEAIASGAIVLLQGTPSKQKSLFELLEAA